MSEPTEAPTTPFSALRTLPSWLLGRAGALGHRLVAERLAELDCRMGHHAVLCAVAEFGPLAQAELARTVRIDPKDLVGVLNELQARELVRREKDPRDARKNAIVLTPAGADLLARLTALLGQANEELLAPLDPAEQAQLLALVTRVIEGRVQG
ncbi:MarR family winged helix-turn-helix transcriptional regulator [Kitasatospora sp. LaBMicrA B282]|uniref:MarR family winged helix-turn-helix transcriptional regulator n=1 Tax=Kitasatospora sp. LaBMicrA B282 TaxID=3420949 RepID=UPI003D152C27